MSSVTSTKTLPAKAARRQEADDDGFRVLHFFVLLALIAATIAVVMAKPSAPANLVLISLTVGAAGLAAMAFYLTIAPLVAPHAQEGREPLSARLRADLEREKALTLRSIKELEFDRAMGKVSEQDCAAMTARLRARALGIMKQLDANESVYRQQIEHELAARLDSKPAAARPAKPAPAVTAPSCACGTANDADARFCKSCGASLAESRA